MRIDPALLQRCWFLAGPTASGKSAVALEVADRIHAEILALDSMTLYRRMDIGTAKPTPADRSRVPHHLFDVLEPWDEYTVADYVTAAERVCREIVARGRTPLFVGGAGLYLRSLLRGVFEGPAADWGFRRELEAAARDQPPGWLHAQLAAIDPAAAARLHPSDLRRLIRALEIHRITGLPASEQQQERPLPAAERPPHVDWLSPPREWLYARIDRRVEAMFDTGLVVEVSALAADPRGMSRTARQALGYKEVLDHLEGRCTLDEARETIQRRTRQFAKRQLTWFRNLEECHAMELTGEETAADIAERLVRGVDRGSPC
jgi:tRNA dimethylallyltransferase